mgnify:FL=1
MKPIIEQLKAMLADESLDESVKQNIRIALVYLNTAVRINGE